MHRWLRRRVSVEVSEATVGQIARMRAMNEPPKDLPHGEDVPPNPPRTRLGAQLLHIRERIVASGEPLLSWTEIEQDIAERRGEAEQRG